MDFSVSTKKNATEILIEIALDLWIAIGSIVKLILSLPGPEMRCCSICLYKFFSDVFIVFNTVVLVKCINKNFTLIKWNCLNFLFWIVYGNNDFCVLILYPTTVPNSFISTSSFFFYL